MRRFCILVSCAVVPGVLLTPSPSRSQSAVPAKRIVLMVGDGMGIATVTAARIHRGALDGMDYPVRGRLVLDDAPRSALVRTASADQMATDSAAGMTAMMTGEKVPNGVLSMRAGSAEPLPTLLEMAEQMGLSTGLVTNTTLTHATPAACYAHLDDRTQEVRIAQELVPGKGNSRLGDGIEAILGGGRGFFLPENGPGEGVRTDGRDLLQEMEGAGYRVVQSSADLGSAVASGADRILGVFASFQMTYVADLEPGNSEPSLAEMASAALYVLERNPRGYFLVVEGGRIDHALHECSGYRAVTEMLAFDETVGEVVKRVGEKGLVLVTSDHDHTMVVSGYAGADRDIFSEAGVDLLEKPYTALLFATGPTASLEVPGELTGEMLGSRDFKERAGVPLDSEAHGAMDVPLYLWGPREILNELPGTVENTDVFDILHRALGE